MTVASVSRGELVETARRFPARTFTVFGTVLALGHPLVYVWLLLAQVVVVVMLFARRETLMRSNREVVLEHR